MDLVRDERGSAPVEFVLVGTLLTLVVLGIVQVALVVYVRNVIHDAAVEGAYHAALADTTLEEGASRTRDILGRVIAADDVEVVVGETVDAGMPVVQVRVRTTLPLLGLVGIPRAWEVTGRAPVESLE